MKSCFWHSEDKFLAKKMVNSLLVGSQDVDLHYKNLCLVLNLMTDKHNWKYGYQPHFGNIYLHLSFSCKFLCRLRVTMLHKRSLWNRIKHKKRKITSYQGRRTRGGRASPRIGHLFSKNFKNRQKIIFLSNPGPPRQKSFLRRCFLLYNVVT